MTYRVTDEELLPCPFCGGSEIILVIGEECGSYRLHCRSEACDVEVATYSVETESEAIAAWNRRTPTARDEALEEAASKNIERLANQIAENCDISPDKAWDAALIAIRQLKDTKHE